MKKYLFILISLFIFAAPADAQTTVTSATTIETARNYYVCPSGQANCAYNGDGGQAATPSDSNTCLTKALPCATFAGVRAKIANKILNAVVTINAADISGGTCYQPDGVLFDQITRGGAPNIFDVVLGGETDAYPSSYIYVKGNLTTPNNVPIVGATTCAGTTPSAKHAFNIYHSNFRIAGVQFKYYSAGQVNGNNQANIWAETINATNTVNVNTSDQDGVVTVSEQSQARLGGAMTITNQMVVMATGASTVMPKTPAGYLNLTFTSSGATYPQFAFCVNEKSHFYAEGMTASFSGTGVYNAYAALIGSTINWNSDTTTSNTVNGANITFLKARQGAQIYETCGATNQTCTFTSMLRRAWADDNAVIYYGSTSGTGTSGNLQRGNSTIAQAKTFPYRNYFLPEQTSESASVALSLTTASSSQTFHAPNISTVRSRGTLNSRSIVSSGDTLLNIDAAGQDTSSTAQTAGRIAVFVDGTPGANDMPGRIELSTTADGAASPTTRVIINNKGITNLYFGSSVASAGTITPTGNVFSITGTTTISTISTTGITAGTVLHMVTASAVIFDEAGNIDITGATSLTTSAGYLVVSVWDGTKWRTR
jgi:hypothetical protein